MVGIALSFCINPDTREGEREGGREGERERE